MPAAEEVERRLVEAGRAAYLLDRRLSGEGLSPGRVARLFADSGAVAVVALPAAAAQVRRLAQGAARGRGPAVPRVDVADGEEAGEAADRVLDALGGGVPGLMRKLVLIALIGLGAQLVDGALGMAYGATSTSLLLSAGLAPAVVSATVHLAEIGTTAASGAAHWRFGNIDRRTVKILTGPGFVGAFLGAVVLSSLSAEDAAPIMGAILMALGVYVLLRFSVLGGPPVRRGREKPLPRIFLAPLGLFAGFMDAAGGGGWGPIGTPAILSSGRLEPRKVIGSIDTSEFAVALGASAGFLVSLGSERIDFAWAGALLAGGLVAAPIAAWLVRILPPRLLGAGVGGLIILTNAKTVGSAIGLDDGQLVTVYVLVALGWAAALATAITAIRRSPQTA